MKLSTRRRKFNEAFRVFVNTGIVLDGYQYIEKERNIEVVPHFQCNPFQIDNVWHKFIRSKWNGVWANTAALVSPNLYEIEEGID